MAQANNVVSIVREKVLAKGKSPTFQVAVKHVSNPHKAQAFLNYGSTPGPWVSVGFNETVYSFGYLPKKKKRVESPRAVEE
jgi:hypothetical protein